jgi:hypothetical protein
MKGLVRCCAAIVVVSLVGSSEAGSITYTVNYTSEWGIPPIPQFDPALGQLLDVEVTIVGTDVAMYQTSPNLTSATYYLTVNAYLASMSVGGAMASTTYSGDLGFNLNVSADYFSSVDLTSQLEPFYGTGQLFLKLIEFAGLAELSPSDAFAFGIRGFDSGTETITYNFVAPEPPGVIMAGTAALIGLGCWLRRRKALSFRQG